MTLHERDKSLSDAATQTTPLVSTRYIYLSLLAFAALTATFATRHEMWSDEVRAFSIATRSPSWASLFKTVHEEGAPIVWYAILRIGYALTHSALVLPIASLLIAWCAAYVMLRFAPFPFWMRLLAVFGAFLGYEYSVQCRNYGIGILLMLTACSLFSTRHEHPIRLGIVMALLANTSVPAAIAAAMLTFVWTMDIARRDDRRRLFTGRSLAAISIAIAGGTLALWSAQPPPEITHAVQLSHFAPREILGTILLNPGRVLMGFDRATITAGEQLPWESIGLNPTLPAVILTDLAIAGVLWTLRRNVSCLAAAVVAVLLFEILFRFVDMGSLRHEGMLAFTLISLCWIAISEEWRVRQQKHRPKMALGLIPLLVTQAAAYPWIVKTEVERPVSASKAFGDFIRRTPAYQNAILMSEPDYLMQALPYYVSNRIYSQREKKFIYWVRFDLALRRIQFEPVELLNIGDSLACAYRRPVLLSIGGTAPVTDSSARGSAGLSPPGQRWNETDRKELFARATPVFSLFRSVKHEDFNTFALSCGLSPATSTNSQE